MMTSHLYLLPMENSPENRDSRSDMIRARTLFLDWLPAVVALVLLSLDLRVRALRFGGLMGSCSGPCCTSPRGCGSSGPWSGACAAPDEYQRRRCQLEALAIGFGVLTMAIYAVGLLQAVGVGDLRQLIQISFIGSILIWIAALLFKTPRSPMRNRLGNCGRRAVGARPTSLTASTSPDKRSTPSKPAATTRACHSHSRSPPYSANRSRIFSSPTKPRTPHRDRRLPQRSAPTLDIGAGCTWSHRAPHRRRPTGRGRRGVHRRPPLDAVTASGTVSACNRARMAARWTRSRCSGVGGSAREVPRA